MPSVVFGFRDSRGRAISRKLFHTSTVPGTIISEAGTLAGLWNPLTDLALEGINIAFTDISMAFAGAAVSNRDENTSVRVLQANGVNADFNLPDMPDALMPTELLDVTLLAVTDFFAQFQSPNNWRINVNNPQEIIQVISGRLDK